VPIASLFLQAATERISLAEAIRCGRSKCVEGVNGVQILLEAHTSCRGGGCNPIALVLEIVVKSRAVELGIADCVEVSSYRFCKSTVEEEREEHCCGYSGEMHDD
jgi:hypothetical protein